MPAIGARMGTARGNNTMRGGTVVFVNLEVTVAVAGDSRARGATVPIVAAHQRPIGARTGAARRGGVRGPTSDHGVGVHAELLTERVLQTSLGVTAHLLLIQPIHRRYGTPGPTYGDLWGGTPNPRYGDFGEPV